MSEGKWHTNQYGEQTTAAKTAIVSAVIAGAILALVLVIVAVGWIAAWEKTSGGEVAVVRNGGPFDNNRIRQVIPPASKRTYAGLWSHVHKYPAQQRFYKISSDPGQSDSGEVDRVRTPTSDGVNVGVEGTIYFNLNTDQKLLRSFDDRFGTRKFDGKHPYEGDEGFQKFLNTILRPVIDNNLRKQIGSVTCTELVSSCALVQNQGNLRAIRNDQGAKAQQNLQRIEGAVNQGLQDDIRETLGAPYLTGIRFSLVRVDLPTRVDQAVEEAQAAFGEISKSEAKRQTARNEAAANRERQRGYQSCPACARIDTLKAIPPNVTTFAPGGNFAVTP